MNVFKYYDEAKRVRITAIDDIIIQGDMYDFVEQGERSDLEEPRDGLVVRTWQGRLIHIYDYEIKRIKVLKWRDYRVSDGTPIDK